MEKQIEEIANAMAEEWNRNHDFPYKELHLTANEFKSEALAVWKFLESKLFWMKTFTVYHFPKSTLYISHELKRCYTEFRDGSTIAAAPREDQAGFAKELGYDDVWEMVWHHEVIHNHVGLKRQEKVSQVLWDVAHGIEDPTNHAIEEGECFQLHAAVLRGTAEPSLEFIIEHFKP